MSDTVIQIENLWKQYRLGAGGHGRIVKDLQSWWAKKRGKDDPNSRLLPGVAAQNNTGDDWFWALQDVSFEAKEGEVIGIIGRNGAGKSTLLKILSRVTTPTRGEITITGRVASLLEVGTGFHPELTGRENVFLNGAILGMSKAEIRRKFDEIVAFSEVEKFINTPVKRYSSGMYVRLAFGVAAHLEPEILIVDEVLAVGDMAFQRKCLGKMEAVGKEGRTVLFVSHNMPSVQKLCSRALLLDQGRVKQVGDVSEIVSSYLYLGGENSLSWEREDTSGKAACFKRIYAADPDGLPRSYIETGDQLILVLEYVINEPSSFYRMNLALTDELGSQIFTTSPDDLGFEMPAEPGVYRATVAFPRNILMPRRYGIKVIFWKRFERYLDVVESIRFVPQETLSLANDAKGERNGMIAVACDWTMGG
jgi:lipopolysaccharide transport system ATP-binding protein